jgi:hypothetical protein
MSASQCRNSKDDVGAFHSGKAKGKDLRMSGNQQIRRYAVPRRQEASKHVR